MNSEKRKTLLPHDQISETKNFYSLTPLGCKFVNSAHHLDVMRLYEQLKRWERPDLVEELRLLENVSDVSEYRKIKKEIKDRSKQQKMSKNANNN